MSTQVWNHTTCPFCHGCGLVLPSGERYDHRIIQHQRKAKPCLLCGGTGLYRVALNSVQREIINAYHALTTALLEESNPDFGGDEESGLAVGLREASQRVWSILVDTFDGDEMLAQRAYTHHD